MRVNPLEKHPTIGGLYIRRTEKGRVHYYVLVPCALCEELRPVRKDYAEKKKYSVNCRKCTPPPIMVGNDNPSWKGGRIEINRGYIGVKIYKDSSFYSMANRHGYVPEHRLVFAQHLNRCLDATEIIHHIDGDKTNNNLSNLELLTRGGHSHQYRKGYELGYRKGYSDGLRAASGAN